MVTPLACSLVGRDETVVAGPRHSCGATLYGVERVTESYMCNYGLDPGVGGPARGGRPAGQAARGHDGEVRIVELDEHPFFLATLFLPQLHQRPGRAAPSPARVRRGGRRSLAARCGEGRQQQLQQLRRVPAHPRSRIFVP